MCNIVTSQTQSNKYVSNCCKAVGCENISILSKGEMIDYINAKEDVSEYLDINVDTVPASEYLR